MKMSLKPTLTVKLVFQDAFRGNGSKERTLKRLSNIYSKLSLEEFLPEFTLCLRLLFVSGQKCPEVDRTLDTAARFVAQVCEKVGREDEEPAEEEDNTDSLFVREVFTFIVTASNAKDQWARLRACQFVNKVLSKMTEDACIDDELCNTLMNHMLERMQDKVPMVRIQAVLSLQRLQCPQDPNCPVIKRLLFHMENDPSMEVRRAVLRIIAKSNITVPYVIQRTRDVKDGVRRQAFAKVATIKLRAFSIKQRVQLLSDGLKDRSETVRNFVSHQFLPTWLTCMEGKYLDFLHALYLENSVDLGELVLKTLFQHEHLRDALDTLKAIQKDRLVPVEGLTLESALFWRCLAEHLQAEGQEETLEEVVPNLSPYVDFLKSYFLLHYGNSEKLPGVKHEMILVQLLKMTSVFDLSDEMGRSCLKQQILDMLMKDNVTGNLISQLVDTLVRVVPTISTRLQDLAEVISEIHQPLVQVTHVEQMSAAERIQRDVEQAKLRMKLNELEEDKREAVSKQDFIQAQMLKDKLDAVQNELRQVVDAAEPTVTQEQRREERNDRATLSKCLMIVYEMMQAKELDTLAPQLRTLCFDFVMPCMKVEDPVVRPLASKALATMCLLDRDFAKEHMLVFYLQIANSDDDAVCVMAIKIIFDLFLQYGLETFDIEITADDDDDGAKKRKTRSKKLYDVTSVNDLDVDCDDETTQPNSPKASSSSSISLFSIITNLLDCTDKEVRDATVLGLCKLMLAQRITSSVLIMRLIIMWFNPVSEDDNHLRQMLGTFFTQFVTTCDWSITTLEEAFLPTLRTVYEAPNSSPLSNIELQAIVRFFVNLTQPGAGRNGFEGNVHNNLAMSLCSEVLKEPDSDLVTVLLYALSMLKVSLDDDVVRDQLAVLARKIKAAVDQKDALRYLKKFQQQLAGGSWETTASTDTHASAVDSLRSSAALDSLQSSSNTLETSLPAQVPSAKAVSGKQGALWNPTSQRSHLSHGSTESESSNSPRWSLRSRNNTMVPESPDVSSEDSESEDTT
ncbi:condensin complex subunit 3 [Bacillus rossius redtenbacheri]|uniref:condensin complex subunit 3 n=1 Tax=Bacillus rossius redtenbacheri TaxID=93214 RepID=UPI002FDF03F3